MSEPAERPAAEQPLPWSEVPGWFDFADIYAEAVAAAPEKGARFVELGTFYGRSAFFMAEAIRSSGKDIRFDTIDSSRRDATNIPRNENAPWVEELARRHGNVRLVFEHFLARTGLGRWMNAITADCTRAHEHYQDRSLDLVFIDADHKYEPMVATLKGWMPKVRPGGVLAGHDHILKYPGVEQAVREVLGDGGYMVRRSSFWTRVL